MQTPPAIDLAIDRSASTDHSAALARLVHLFETLQPQTIAQLLACYAPQARFKDPFNDVTGQAEINRIFLHMFEALESPRFIVTQQLLQGNQCFLTWEFHFRFRSFHKDQPQCILGASQLVFSDTGHVTLHRDYWDAAEELYEKLPLVGSLMRWLKKRAN